MKQFINNVKCRAAGSTARTTRLSAAELKEASLFWLSYVQKIYFASELQALKNHTAISKSSSLLPLHPFLGEDQLIRLGGRIDNSPLSFDERHPIILPKHRISDLLIAQAHKATLHGGTQLTLRNLRQKFWIISARTRVKYYIQNCVKCARERARPSQQLMGNLPRPRLPLRLRTPASTTPEYYSVRWTTTKIEKILCCHIYLSRDEGRTFRICRRLCYFRFSRRV